MLRELFDTSIKTATVTRYSQSKLMRDESVMEHIGNVAFMCCIIGEIHPNIDKLELLKRAILHDIEESRIGDIASPIKHDNPTLTSEIHKISHKSAERIFSDLGQPQLYETWVFSKDDTLEGRALALVDVLSVVMKIYEEVIIYHNY